MAKKIMLLFVTFLLCVSTVTYPVYAGEQSEKTPKKYILIQAPGSRQAKMVTDIEQVKKIELAYKKLEKLYEDIDGGFFWGYAEEWVEYYVYSIENGLMAKEWPYYYVASHKELNTEITSALKAGKNVSVYNFLAGNPQKHLSLMKSLNSRENLSAFYPESSLTSQYPYIQLEYHYNNAANNYKYAWEMFSYEKELGEFACDNVFKPVIKYLEDNSMLFEFSRADFSSGVSDGQGYECFNRRIKIYVNRPLKAEEKTYIEKIWLNKLNNTPYYKQTDLHESYELDTPYKYIEAPQYYPIVLLSGQSLKKNEIAELEKLCGIKSASGS